MTFKRKSWRVVIMLLALSWMMGGRGVAAREVVPLEYEVKAAYLFNFGKFVSWPAGCFSASNAPLVIGVWGGNPFHEDLRNMVAGKRIAGHPVEFRVLTSTDEAKDCQILFVSQAAQKDASAIFAALHGASVLTVTENLPHFAGSSFAINLVMSADSIRFQINNPAAEHAGLTISSKLRSLSLPPNP